MALFDAPTGAAGPVASGPAGSPEYQNAIVQQTAQRLKPAYAKALQGTQQNFSGRGLLDSGLGAQAELGLQGDYLGKLGDTAETAATRGADLAERNRQREEERGWKVMDRDKQLEYLKDQANQNREAQGQQAWMNLIGGAASAAGGPLGSLLYSVLNKPKTPAPDTDEYDAGVANERGLQTMPY